MKYLVLLSLIICFGCAKDTGKPANNPPPVSQSGATPTPVPGQTPTPTPASHGFVKSGHWGGTEISLEVASPQSKYELSCAHGTIDQPLALDQLNHFSEPGTFTPEHGGPIHSGEPQPSYSAQYDGTVVGDMMDLIISYQKDGIDNHLSFRLIYNQQTTVHKCL